MVLELLRGEFPFMEASMASRPSLSEASGSVWGDSPLGLVNEALDVELGPGSGFSVDVQLRLNAKQRYRAQPNNMFSFDPIASPL